MRSRIANPVITLVALGSAVVGVLANVYLVLFYVVAKPWQPGAESNDYGTINDWLVALQLALLIPVVVWLGQQTRAEQRARRWTVIALAASATACVLQLLVVTGVLRFEVQFPLVSLCIVLLFCWAHMISRAGQRVGLLSPAAVHLGRLMIWALPVGIAAFAAGIGVSAFQGEGSWAWVVGGLPGALAWLAFPIWVLYVARDAGASGEAFSATARRGHLSGRS